MGASSMATRLVEILIVCAWLGLMGVLALRTSGHGPSSAGGADGGIALLEAVDSEDAEWMGVYMDDQKIGAALSDRIPTQDGFRIQERSYLKIRAFEQDKEITTAFVAETDKGGRLRGFNFYLSAPPVRTDVAGEVQGDALELTMSSGGEVTHQRLPLPEGTHALYLQGLGTPGKGAVMASGVGPGQRLTHLRDGTFAFSGGTLQVDAGPAMTLAEGRAHRAEIVLKQSQALRVRLPGGRGTLAIRLRGRWTSRKGLMALAEGVGIDSPAELGPRRLVAVGAELYLVMSYRSKGSLTLSLSAPAGARLAGISTHGEPVEALIAGLMAGQGLPTPGAAPAALTDPTLVRLELKDG